MLKERTEKYILFRVRCTWTQVRLSISMCTYVRQGWNEAKILCRRVFTSFSSRGKDPRTRLKLVKEQDREHESRSLWVYSNQTSTLHERFIIAWTHPVNKRFIVCLNFCTTNSSISSPCLSCH